jgi:hypothetical protein
MEICLRTAHLLAPIRVAVISNTLRADVGLEIMQYIMETVQYKDGLSGNVLKSELFNREIGDIIEMAMTRPWRKVREKYNI